MDPNHWASNFNQSYGRLAPAGAPLPTNASHLPLIDQQALATSGLGALSPPLPAHTNLSPPRLAGLPGVNYAAHPALHPAVVNPFIESVASLGTTFATQSPYKTVSQAVFTLPQEATPTSRFSTSSSTPSVSNALTSAGYSAPLTNQATPHHTSQQSNPYAQIDALSNSFSAAPNIEPPPAHSGSRPSTIQRNPYQKDYGMAVPGTGTYGVREREQLSTSSPRQPQGYQEPVRSLTSANVYTEPARSTYTDPARTSQVNYNQRSTRTPTQQYIAYSAALSTSSFNSHSNSVTYSNSRLDNAYDPVSPAAPNNNSDGNFSSSISLQDIADTMTSDNKITSLNNHNTNLNQHVLGTNMQDISPVHSIQQQSPMQPSPISVGSPQVPMSMGSPQPNPIASSSVPPPQPPPVQAPADSTTKPRRPRKTKPKAKEKGPPPLEHIPIQTPTAQYQTFDTVNQQAVEALGLPSPYKVAYNLPTPQTTANLYTQPTMLAAGIDVSTVDTSGLQFTTHPLGFPISTPQAMLIPQHMKQEEESIFLTNTYGNAFSSPPPMHHEIVPQEDDEYKKYRTKVEQPQFTVQDDLDDEFGHLSAPPKEPPPGAKVREKTKPPPIVYNPPEEVEAPAAQPSQQKISPFQDSFLSFIEGKKPETLSSVTNSNIINKPQLPKYVPDPRPRRAVTELPKPTPSKSSSDSMEVPAVTFSDDEDNSNQGMNKAVASVISNLSEDSSTPAKSKSSSTPAKSHSNTPAKSHSNTTPAKSNTPSQKSRQPGSVPKKKGPLVTTIKLSGVRKPPVPEYISDGEDIEITGGVDDDDGEPPVKVVKPPKKAAKKEPTPPPPRERSSRQAKTKVEQKRKQKQEKKKTKKKRYSDDDSLSDASDFVAISSSDEDVEKGYDSDKDPAWQPGLNPVAEFVPEKRALSSGSEDESGRTPRYRGKVSKRGRTGSASKSGRGRGPQVLSASPPVNRGQSGRKMTQLALPDENDGEVMEVLSDGDESPHNYQKGDFVIERSDLKKTENFPIWKIDAGRLLQKYEYTVKDGGVVHKSMSTYSSWAESVRKQFKAIKVKVVSIMRGQEIVQVLDEFMPKSAEEKPETENDPLSTSFNVYMQILISQALEPGFLGAIQSETDEYYTGPLKQIDSLLDEEKKTLKRKFDWENEFQDFVDKLPYLNISDRPNNKGHCQATMNADTPAVKAAQLSGEAYKRDTLDTDTQANYPTKVFLVGVPTATVLTRYHGLQHFKHTLYKRCLAKVGVLRESNASMENREILDQCLQNRNWVKKLYTDLKTLLKTGS